MQKVSKFITEIEPMIYLTLWNINETLISFEEINFFNRLVYKK